MAVTSDRAVPPHDPRPTAHSHSSTGQVRDETIGAQIEWQYYLEQLVVQCFVLVVSMVMLVIAAAKGPDDCPLLKFMNVRRTYIYLYDHQSFPHLGRVMDTRTDY